VNLNTIHVCLLKLSIRKFDCSRHIYTCCKIIRYLGIQKLHVSQFYRLYLFRIDRKNINDTICSNVDYHNILFALMHQIVEKELPVQAKPAKVNNNSKRPVSTCIFCYVTHASAVPHLFLISITQILLKMSYLQKENKVTIHKTFMKDQNWKHMGTLV